MLQTFFCWYFRSRRDDWHLLALAEQRVQIEPSRFRIPDVCLVAQDDPDALIVRHAPVLCIEILSRDDSMTEILNRVDDYRRTGVQAVWVIDPWLRKAFYASQDGSLLHEAEMLRAPGTPVELPVTAIFAELPAIRSGS